jgi:DNA-binding transcriptional ArsR family regulator
VSGLRETQQRLAGLAAERKAYERLLRDVRLATASALIGVRDSDEFSLTEAAEILGLSRPTVYALLEDAERAK